MIEIFLGYVFGALVYGYIVLMLNTSGRIHKEEWLFTIPIWPLALLVLLICVVLRGLEVLVETIGL